MSHIFKKYEFNSKEQAKQKIANLLHKTDELTEISYLNGGHINYTYNIMTNSYN